MRLVVSIVHCKLPIKMPSIAALSTGLTGKNVLSYWVFFLSLIQSFTHSAKHQLDQTLDSSICN